MTTFLWKKQASDPKKPMRFVFHLRIISLHQEKEIFTKIKDTLEKYAPTGQPLKDEQPEDPTSWVAHVEVPVSAGFLGDKARVRLTALART